MRLDNADYASTPADYEVDGVFSTNDGDLVEAYPVDLTFREMVNGALESYPREQPCSGSETKTALYPRPTASSEREAF